MAKAFGNPGADIRRARTSKARSKTLHRHMSNRARRKSNGGSGG